MKILFLTDLHGVTRFLPALAAAEAPCDLVLVGGDLSSFGGADEAARVVDALSGLGARLLAVPGNVDRPEAAAWLQAKGLSLHGRGMAMGPVWVSGLGGSNHTPLGTPLEHSEAEIAELLAAGRPTPPLPPRGAGDDSAQGASPRAPRPWILVSHVPPHDTLTDRTFFGAHVGSPALADFLVAERPDACLCGHIHEAAATELVHQTLVCNPGSLTRAGYARIRVQGGRVEIQRRVLDLPLGERLREGADMLQVKLRGFLLHRLGRG